MSIPPRKIYCPRKLEFCNNWITEDYIKFNEYPQSSKSVNSMFETRSVSICAEFEPFKKVEAEISPVELIAEIIEIERPP